jgi:hypothetical protein
MKYTLFHYYTARWRKVGTDTDFERLRRQADYGSKWIIVSDRSGIAKSDNVSDKEAIGVHDTYVYNPTLLK